MNAVIHEAAQRLRYAGDHFHDAGLIDRAESDWAAAGALLALLDHRAQAAWALCRHEACGHRWIVVYLPMELVKAANAMKRATCPKCGDTRPLSCAAPEDPVQIAGNYSRLIPESGDA